MTLKVKILQGYKPKGDIVLPRWSQRLTNLYWVIRVETRNAPKRRKFYRLVEKEKLRLAELGIDQELIRVTCRYLSSYSVVSGRRMIELMNRPIYQMSFDFTRGGDFYNL